MSLFAAIRFITIFPLPGKEAFSDRLLGRASAWYPLVGALIGGVLLLTWYLCGLLWPIPVQSAIVVVLWIILTRGFHLDGLADTADGIGGGAGREAKLDIMKDSRVGTFGVLSLVALLLLKFVFLTGFEGNFWRSLLLAPVLGRWVMLLNLFIYPAANRKGLGHTVKQHCRWPQLVIGSVTALAASILLFDIWGPVVFVSVGGLAVLIAAVFCRSLGGLNGDTYGALCEIGELFSLAATALLCG